jgi:hypothetical protein
MVQAQCAFNGAWGGGNRHPTAFYVSSYFWDRATDAGIIREQDAIMWDLKPADLVTAATLACSTPIVGLAALFPKVRHTLLAMPRTPWPPFFHAPLPGSASPPDQCGISTSFLYHDLGPSLFCLQGHYLMVDIIIHNIRKRSLHPSVAK